MTQETPVVCSWGHLKAAAVILSAWRIPENQVLLTHPDSWSYLSND